MAQVSILNGIYADGSPELRASYPVNCIPVPAASGMSTGYLRPGYGTILDGTGPGVSRGAIEWNGACYRVMDSSLVRIDSAGNYTTIGLIAGSDNVSMDYSFDRLSISGGGVLHYYNGATLTTVTDPDIGTVLDHTWIDGYFITTDGEFIVQTELNDPTSVNPLKYGSSEVDPDPIKAVDRVRGELVAMNRHTIEYFSNVGGDNFAFQRVDGAQVQKGIIGTHAYAVYLDAIGFVGSGRNEPPSVYIAGNGATQKIATREIDKLLTNYSESELALCKVEAKVDQGHQHLMIHLPDRCLVYDAAASQAVGEPVWFVLTSGTSGFAKYRARDHVWCYGKWLAADSTTGKYGYLSGATSSHWGDKALWEFGTMILYNEGKGAIIHDMELVTLTGAYSINDTPTISTAYSNDGETWSVEKYISCGTIGQRVKRLKWFGCGLIQNWRIQRFRGDTDAHITVVRLDASLEGLVY